MPREVNRDPTRNGSCVLRLAGYVISTMLYEFSLPTKADKVPTESEWIHEIKYDGYRMMLMRDHDRLRLISRGGHDWAKHFSLIVSAALKLPQMQFVIDGEMVVLKPDGVSDFDALASRKHDKRAMLYAFRHAGRRRRGFASACALAAQSQSRPATQALKRPIDGIFIAQYEQGDEQSDIGKVPFRVACNMGLEGIVSKRLDRADGAGRCKHWIKIKNPAHPAYSRARDTIIASRQQAVVVDQ
jgi:bifunctional non-homologous end joining protein LigD